MKFFKNSKYKIILLMGGPGSGKSFQAAKCTSFDHISTGAILRAIVNDFKHPQAKFINDLMQKGRLIHDELLMSILKKAIHPLNEKTYLLDGFPRTSMQWQLYKELFDMPLGIIDLQLSREQMFQNMIERNREDDKKEVINSRLDDYYRETLPLSIEIKKECYSNCFTINAGQSMDKVQVEFSAALNKLQNPEYINDDNKTYPKA